MHVVCARDPRWLSNSWLVADREGGHAVLIDSGGPVEEICAAMDRLRVRLTHVLCTHHHPDHIAFNDTYRTTYGVPVIGHEAERSLFGSGLDGTMAHDETLRSGELTVRALHIPGHTLGQLGFVVSCPDEADIGFTGDTLFRGSVGGTRGSGHTTFEDLQHSIMNVLLHLPDTTVLYPGHMEPTTVGTERRNNPFIKLWRGDKTPGTEQVQAQRRPAILELEAPDYDGGSKCQVRFDDGEVAIVGGSRVTRAR